MHYSDFAKELYCHYCGSINSAKEWPIKGDMVPFYFQNTQGRFNVKVSCQKCKKDWYVVWDQNPGDIQTLDI